ncbi:hypothetical protein BGZ49_000150 [Haplosporangium sp. Z 27]|nr:hypothetical protein BGZ49_000150 [Haplosporangium sp. Z 27]
MAVPVCWSVRDHVAEICHEPFKQAKDTSISQEQIRDSLFSPLHDTRWASSSSVEEPNCVSFQDHGLGSSPIDNIKIENDLKKRSAGQPEDREVVEYWLEERSDSTLDPVKSESFLFSGEAMSNDNGNDLVKSTLEVRHLSRRERVKHHHQEKRGTGHPTEARDAESNAEEVPSVRIRADHAHEQVVYSIGKENAGSSGVAGGSDSVVIHESLSHSEINNGQQKAFVQAGTEAIDPDGLLAKASESNDNSLTDETVHPHKDTVLLAAVPILLLMGAVAGFTVYRRYYENSFNVGGRNDTRDDYPTDGCYQRDIPIRKGSPIHFDRTFLNTPHSPPSTATYLHDPDSPSRNRSPSSIASASMKRPPPSAGSFGKTRFQELSRSYDFGAGFRTIKNALIRSNNNSREGALDKASGKFGSSSSSSLPSRPAEYSFGAGGHSIAKIGSHPGLNVLERQQLQQQYGIGGSSSSRFPDMKTLTVPQEHSIIWGQYSANDGHIYQDAASAVASNLARKSISSNSLSNISSGKYGHHHQQSSGHQPDTPTDSIGDCLSPESPSMTRAEMMRRRALYSEGYIFASEMSESDDAHSGTDLLFDTRDNFLGLGLEKVYEASLALRDEEMDMYLSMEKEESPFPLNDFNTMNPSPYEPKVLARRTIDTNMIQKTAVLSEKEEYPSRPSLDHPVEEFNEKQALKAENQVIVASAGLEVPEETHVLGCASPEWAASEYTAKQVPNTDAFGQVQTALKNISERDDINAEEPIANESLDLREREGVSIEGIDSAPQQHQGQNKKKGNKSMAKNNRK